MSVIIITNIYLFILAGVLAILEIQIEGKHGWAENLPTWRPKNKNWFIKFYTKLMSDREPTGYHMTMFSFVLLILHLPYVFGLPFNLFDWSMTVSFFFIFVILWDYLWFVLNPHHPLKKFKQEHIWWHKKWFWLAPSDYYISIILSLLVLLPAVYHYQSSWLIEWWAINIILFAIETLIVALFTIYVLDIDNWNNKK